MRISQEQLQAIDHGQPVPVSVEGRQGVLLPGPLYEQLREHHDDWHPATMHRHMPKIMADDWDDPAMSVYSDL